MRIINRKVFGLLGAMVITLSAGAQDVYTDVLKEVEEGSTMLRALHEQMIARQAGNHVGLTPSDPEVEFGYLWSRPAAGGNRKDVSLTQQFDFPTAYVERSRLAGVQDQTHHLDYLQQRQQILLQAKQTCVELIYQNALHRLYSQQAEWARQTADACRNMLEQGETNRLDYNKAILNLTEMESQTRETNVMRKQLAVSLSAMAGGRQIALDTCDYPALPVLPEDFDLWYTQNTASNPVLQYQSAQLEASQRKVKVTRAEALPKFSVAMWVSWWHRKSITVSWWGCPYLCGKTRVRCGKLVPRPTLRFWKPSMSAHSFIHSCVDCTNRLCSSREVFSKWKPRSAKEPMRTCCEELMRLGKSPSSHICRRILIACRYVHVIWRHGAIWNSPWHSSILSLCDLCGHRYRKERRISMFLMCHTNKLLQYSGI